MNEQEKRALSDLFLACEDVDAAENRGQPIPFKALDRACWEWLLARGHLTIT